jgi:hypothetical protein
MATISELVETVADVEGMESATVALIARYLREKRLIQKRGRGPSAAQMGVRDAANLLIAVNASGSARDAALVVPIYRDLVSQEFRSNQKKAPKSAGAFGEAIELVLHSIIKGSLPDTFLSQEVPGCVQDSFEEGKASISIHFIRPEPRGYVSIMRHNLARVPVWDPYSQTEHIGLTPYPMMMTPPLSISLSFWMKHGRQDRESWKLKVGDRADETRIGNRTIVSVARILRQQHGLTSGNRK